MSQDTPPAPSLTKPPNYGAIPLVDLGKLNDFFQSFPMPRKDSDAYVEILRNVIAINLETKPAAVPASGE